MAFDCSVKYDVLIVGAGPAGSTLARLLADSGRRILLVNGQTPGRAKTCGGLLAPDAQKALAAFDLTLPKSVLVDPQIFSVKTIDAEAGLVRYYSRFYMNTDRGKFDDWLRSLVPNTVDTVRARCSAAVRTGPQEFSVTLSLADGTRQTVSARCIVGADGANSIVRRSFYPSDIRYYISIQQWFRTDDRVNPFYSCIFDPVTSESCSWSICKDGFFVYGGSFAPNRCREMFELQKQRLDGKYGFRFSEPLHTEACKVFRPRLWRDFVTGTDGVFLVGEAAGFISPSSFEGISSAILSGKYLARSIAGSGNPAAAARRYRLAALPLKLKLQMKCIKRLFMYVPLLRRIVMRLGLLSIRMDIR